MLNVKLSVFFNPLNIKFIHSFSDDEDLKVSGTNKQAVVTLKKGRRN